MSDRMRSVSGEVVDESSSLTPNTQDRTPAPTLPAPRLPGAGVRIRPGVLADYPFIDDLQKQHKKAVGFMWEAAIKGHIEKGNVLVAEAAAGDGCWVSGVGQEHDGSRAVGIHGALAPTPNPQDPTPTPVGYILGVDRYLKRDELGIIYQLNVAPGSQRGLIGANLLKAKFERSAYGCRLYCCWCAQDLAANRFWEAMGFVPLAFRTGGGRGKTKKDGTFRGRMHIFWQKRIREGDTGDPASGGTPYWFPSQTGAGAIGEDRLVLPIPPGTHWRDAKPVVLPESPGISNGVDEEVKRLETRVSELQKAKKAAKTPGSASGSAPGSLKAQGQSKQVAKVKAVAAGGLHFGERPKSVEEQQAEKVQAEAKAAQEKAAAIEAELKAAKKAARKAKKKFDPAQEAFARELKDRWLEQVAARPGLLAAGSAKYEVSRRIDPTMMASVRLGDPERLGLPDAA